MRMMKSHVLRHVERYHPSGVGEPVPVPSRPHLRLKVAVPVRRKRLKLTPRFTRAVELAADLHSKQLRKGTEIPYVSHLLAVTSVVIHYGGSEDHAIAALLHDVVEDAPKRLGAAKVRATILRRFGRVVADIVDGCTDATATPKPKWRKRKESYVSKAAEASADVVLVAASDKLHNVLAILSDYRRVKDGIWARFNPDAGKAGTIGYYRGLVKAYQKTGHHPELVDELDDAVSRLEREASHRGRWPL